MRRPIVQEAFPCTGIQDPKEELSDLNLFGGFCARQRCCQEGLTLISKGRGWLGRLERARVGRGLCRY